jgi:hypothetical protein
MTRSTRTLAIAFAGLVAFAGIASADDQVISVNQSVRDVQIKVVPFEGRNSGVGVITWTSTDGGHTDVYAVQRQGRVSEGRNAAPVGFAPNQHLRGK